MEFKEVCIAAMAMGKKSVCMLVKAMLRSREQKKPDFLLPKLVVREARWIRNSSSESLLVNTGLRKTWVIMKMSRSSEEKVILSQSNYCSFMVGVCVHVCVLQVIALNSN